MEKRAKVGPRAPMRTVLIGILLQCIRFLKTAHDQGGRVVSIPAVSGVFDRK